MILVDSNVFLIDLRYPRDANASANGSFLTELKVRGDGATSITNLLPRWTAGRLLERVSRKLSLGDAMVLEHAEVKPFGIRQVVSWDAAHFIGKTRLEVVTPAQFLAG